jgi:iron-sulfur cluster insertion protein
MNIEITEKAKQKIKSIASGNNVDTVIFGVQGGGCSGFMYKWDIANSDSVTDHEFIEVGDNIKLATDAMSFMYVQGCTIDYTEDLTGSRLVVNNPLAVSSCGCGESITF